jgi:hypothetical protein
MATKDRPDSKRWGNVSAVRKFENYHPRWAQNEKNALKHRDVSGLALAVAMIEGQEHWYSGWLRDYNWGTVRRWTKKELARVVWNTDTLRLEWKKTGLPVGTDL